MKSKTSDLKPTYVGEFKSKNLHLNFKKTKNLISEATN